LNQYEAEIGTLLDELSLYNEESTIEREKIDNLKLELVQRDKALNEEWALYEPQIHEGVTLTKIMTDEKRAQLNSEAISI
jgi:hypothetical protein